MMTLTLTIDDDAQATRLLNGFCAGTQYDPASGKTKAAWAKERLSDYMKVMAKRGEFKAAQATIVSEIDAVVVR